MKLQIGKLYYHETTPDDPMLVLGETQIKNSNFINLRVLDSRGEQRWLVTYKGNWHEVTNR